MKLERRDFLKKAGLVSLAGLVPWSISCGGNAEKDLSAETSTIAKPAPGSWESIRSDFQLDPNYIHMAGLLLASHPEPVRKAIARYRETLNKNPSEAQENYSKRQWGIRETASKYMNVLATDIGLTESTTMGTALLINGLKIREDQEMLSADTDYFATHQSIEYNAERSGASFRKIPLYDDIHQVSEDEIVEKIIGEIKSNTRLITGTWVHSSTGLKIPVRKIADRIAEVNKGRSKEDRVIFLLDGVHGFGVEKTTVADLGCDLFSAGTHKWMFGPRGTGVIWGNPEIHDQVSPTIPSFTNDDQWGGKMSPGGFKAFEHQWSMVEAFQYHQEIGQDRIQERIHSLSRQLKEGLADMDHVILYTPMEENLSSGIVCFEIEGINPLKVVKRLDDKDIIASVTPYDPSYPRLAPGIYNTNEQMDEVLRAVRELAG